MAHEGSVGPTPTPATALYHSDLQSAFKTYVKQMRELHGPVPRKGEKRGLRIACYNVHFHEPYAFGADEGDVHIKRVIDEELDADVVCLQEVTRPSRAGSHPHVHFHKISFLGNAIMSKIPLLDCASYKYTVEFKEARGICAATIEHPSVGRIRIYNTHLDAFDNSDRVRHLQATELRRIVAMDQEKFSCQDLPALLMGDFNALHRGSYLDAAHWDWIVKQDASRRVTSQTLAMDEIIHPERWFDLFSADPPPVTTWSMRRIDYILAQRFQDFTNNFAWSPWVHYTVASDHLPVGVDLERVVSDL